MRKGIINLLSITCFLTLLISIACVSSKFKWKLISPEKAGISSEGLENVRAAIQHNIDQKRIPGAVTAIVRHNKLVWYEAQGFSDPVSGKPMTRDAIFHMMSSTKQITAVAVLMMMDEGKLSLDDKVSKFIPEFANPKVAVKAPGNEDKPQIELVPADREITIKDLLTHTSGFTGLNVPDSLRKRIEALLNPEHSLSDLIPLLGEVPLDFQPGTKWMYSPLFGMDLLLHIVEIVSGQQADVFLSERIFKPLDMKDTYFSVPPEKKERVVYPYRYQDGEWKQQPTLFKAGPTKYFSGAGGLFSTVHDYINFEIMLLNKGEFNGRRLLKPETVEMMATNQVGSLFSDWIPPVTGGFGFGLGVRVLMDPAKGHGWGKGAFGWGGAYGTESWADPELGVAAAMFIQVDPAPAEPKIDFQEALRNAILK